MAVYRRLHPDEPVIVGEGRGSDLLKGFYPGRTPHYPRCALSRKGSRATARVASGEAAKADQGLDEALSASAADIHPFPLPHESAPPAPLLAQMLAGQQPIARNEPVCRLFRRLGPPHLYEAVAVPSFPSLVAAQVSQSVLHWLRRDSDDPVERVLKLQD